MPKMRRRFTSEFKAKAVKLLAGNGIPLQQVAAELGVHANKLRSWRNEHLAAGSADTLARQKAEAAELTRLREGHRQLVGRRSRRVGRCRPYAVAATPVISAQSSNALVRMARYSVAVT
jgi:transposase-like protein